MNTPGEWRACAIANEKVSITGTCVAVATAPDQNGRFDVIAVTGTVEDKDRYALSLADAILFSASKELLAASQAMIDVISLPLTGKERAAFDLLMAAVKKATTLPQEP